jgi:hypothetical protein
MECPGSGDLVTTTELFLHNRDYRYNLAADYYTSNGTELQFTGSGENPTYDFISYPTLCGSGNNSCVMTIPENMSFEIRFRTRGVADNYFTVLDNGYFPEYQTLNQVEYNSDYAFYQSAPIALPTLDSSIDTIANNIQSYDCYDVCETPYYNYIDWNNIQGCNVYWLLELYRFPLNKPSTSLQSDKSWKESYSTNHLSYMVFLMHDKNGGGCLLANKGHISCASGAIIPSGINFYDLNDYTFLSNPKIPTNILSNSNSASDTTYDLAQGYYSPPPNYPSYGKPYYPWCTSVPQSTINVSGPNPNTEVRNWSIARNG